MGGYRYWLGALLLLAGLGLGGVGCWLASQHITAAPPAREAYWAMTAAELARIQTHLLSTDPGIGILQAFSSEELPAQTLDITYNPGESKRTAVAILTRTQLLDDSVAGKRYRLELQRSSANAPWQIVWGGLQQRCYDGRGHTTWAAKTCV
jgi:hypothetical protein